MKQSDRLYIRIEPNLKQQLEELAAAETRTLSNYVIHILTKHVQETTMSTDTRIDTIRVNFGFELLKKLSGWNDEELEAKEGELDFFLDQEMTNEFGDEADELHATAFYAQSEDYLVEAYDGNDNAVEVDSSRLEKVACNAIECIKATE